MISDSLDVQYRKSIEVLFRNGSCKLSIGDSAPAAA